MKKFLSLALITIVLIGIVRYKYINYRSHDALYAASKYITHSASSSYKLYDVDSYNLEYTDENTAIISIIGQKKISPHATNKCKVVLQKNKNGVWKVKNIYNFK